MIFNMGMLARKFCPQCGSEDVALAVGGLTGMYICKKCGYTGSFPEKEFVGREMEGKK